MDAGMRQVGFAVWLAATGQKALNLYRQGSQVIDVVLLDVRMPGLDGPQTLAGLRDINPQVRCCFMSGDLGSYTGWRLYNLGAAALIRKPFHLGEVAQVLCELVSNAEMTDREPLHVPDQNAGELGCHQYRRGSLEETRKTGTVNS